MASRRGRSTRARPWRNVGSGNGAELATHRVEKGKPFLVVFD
jgi:hypothetical protein